VASIRIDTAAAGAASTAELSAAKTRYAAAGQTTRPEIHAKPLAADSAHDQLVPPLSSLISSDCGKKRRAGGSADTASAGVSATKKPDPRRDMDPMLHSRAIYLCV
jgi:hypothetical protein